MQDRKKNVVRNLTFGLLNKFLSLLFPFVILALIEKKLGTEYLGLNNLFSSILQILSLTEMGIGSALVYEMYKPAANNDVVFLSKILNLYKKIYSIISVVILIIGILFTPFLPKLINGSVPSDINIYILFAIYLFNTFISYSLFAYKKSILNAFQRVDILSKINLFVNIFMYLIQFACLILFKNYYLYVLTIPLCTILDNVFVNLYTKKYYFDIKPKDSVSSEIKNDISKRVRALIGHKVGAVVISSLDSIILSMFLGLNSVALYSNYFYIVKALNGIINIGFTSILSSIGNSLVLESKEHNLRLFYNLNFILSCFVGFCFVCLVTIFQPFMTIWMGKNFLLNFSSVILFSIYFYSWQIRIIGLAFKDAAGMWKDDFWKPYFGLIFNLFANVIFVKFLGLNGVILSTIIVMMFIYFPWETKVLFDNLFNESSKKYVFRQITHFIITLIISFILYKISIMININIYLKILLILIINAIFVSFVYYIVYRNTAEFKYFINEIKKVIKGVVNDGK